MSHAAENREMPEISRKEEEIVSPLFARDDLRVSDLVGDLRITEADCQPEENTLIPLLLHAPAVQRGGPLRLTWYDWAVVALIIASLGAGIVCLLKGV